MTFSTSQSRCNLWETQFTLQSTCHVQIQQEGLTSFRNCGRGAPQIISTCFPCMLRAIFIMPPFPGSLKGNSPSPQNFYPFKFASFVLVKLYFPVLVQFSRFNIKYLLNYLMNKYSFLVHYVSQYWVSRYGG